MKKYVKEFCKLCARIVVIYRTAYAALRTYSALRAYFARVDLISDRINDVRTKLRTSKCDWYIKVPNETSDDDFEE